MVAHLEVAAQKRCAARHDVSDHPAAVTPQLLQWWSVYLQDLRQLRRAAFRGRQGLPRRDRPQGIERAPRLSQVIARHVGVALRGFQTAVAQQGLDRPYVYSRLQKVRRKAMSLMPGPA